MFALMRDIVIAKLYSNKLGDLYSVLGNLPSLLVIIGVIILLLTRTRSKGLTKSS